MSPAGRSPATVCASLDATRRGGNARSWSFVQHRTMRSLERSAGEIGVVFTCIAAALHGGAFVGGFAGTSAAHGIACGALSTGLLTALVVRFALRASTAMGAAMRAMLSSVLAGGINAGLTALVLAVTGQADILGDLGAIVVLGGMVGAFIGVPFGIALTVPVALTTWSVQRPSRSTASWIGLGVASWFALVVVAFPFISYPDRSQLVLAPITLGLLALALTVALSCSGHLVFRAAWLARVRRGRAPGYAIVPTDSVHVRDGLPRWAPSSRHDAVLIEERTDEDGAYRGEVSRHPVAYVSAPSETIR